VSFSIFARAGVALEKRCMPAPEVVLSVNSDDRCFSSIIAII